MSKYELTQKQAIRQVIGQINQLWLSKRYDEIGALLSEDAVIAPPGLEIRIRGREAYVQSYREYDQTATTHEFIPEEPKIDIIGDVAVAVCPFIVVYELQGKTYREKGHDMLVFSRSAGQWQVAWRTMQTKAIEQSTC
jgi:hypothetical protein